MIGGMGTSADAGGAPHAPQHATYLPDLGLVADQIGIDIGASLSGARSLDITRAYVRAFFDQHLRSKPQALLDQPSARYPEVTFCSPETKTRA